MSKTIKNKVYTEAVKIFRKVYKNRPLNENVIRSIMKRIEEKSKNSKKTFTMDEAIDKFLNRNNSYSANQLLKEFEVADDYDPSNSGAVPSFEGQEFDTPFEGLGDNDLNDEYTDTTEVPESNPDVDFDASEDLITERRSRRSEAMGTGLDEDDLGIGDLVNQNYINPDEYDFDTEIDTAIDGINFPESEEDISFDSPLNEDDIIPSIDNPVYYDPDQDEFDGQELDFYNDVDYEDYIMPDEDFLFEGEDKDDEEDEEGKGVVAEGKKKVVKEEDEDKEDKKDKEDDAKEDDKEKDDKKDKEDDKEDKKEEKCKK